MPSSHIYTRLLRGQVTPERYVAVVKRAVDMGFRISRKQREIASELENNPRLRRDG